MFDRIVKYFTEMKEREIEKANQKNIARRERFAKNNAQRTREAIKEYNQKSKEASAKLRRTFTTIEEYKKIAGNRCAYLDKLPPHERDVVAQRVQKLCKEDEKFRKGLMAWAKQNYEIPKKTRPLSRCSKRDSNIIEI